MKKLEIQHSTVSKIPLRCLKVWSLIIWISYLLVSLVFCQVFEIRSKIVIITISFLHPDKQSNACRNKNVSF